MRKLILIATMSLLATHACAGQLRSLSLASTLAQAATEQNMQTADTSPTIAAPPVTTPAPAVTTTTATQPPVTSTTATQPTTPVAVAPTTAAPTTTAPVETTKTVASKSQTTRRRHRQSSPEARVIYELHRHGIYW